MSEETEQLTCEHCGAQAIPGRKFCTQCSFPIEGTEQEKISFRLLVSSRKRFLSDAQDKIKNAKTIIYVLAGFLFVMGLISLLAQDDVASFVANLVLCLTYLILAAWATKNPFAAILTAFVLYLTLQIVGAIVEPITILSGILWKVIFIGAFIKGIRSAYEAKGYLEELKKLKAVPVDAG
jgi:hypothetical protein